MNNIIRNIMSEQQPGINEDTRVTQVSSHVVYVPTDNFKTKKIALRLWKGYLGISFYRLWLGYWHEADTIFYTQDK